MKKVNGFEGSTRAGLGLFAAVLLCSLAVAVGRQDVDERPGPPPLPEMPGSGNSAMDELQAQLVRLFGEVETHLKEVDNALFEASGVDPYGDGSGVEAWIEGATNNGRAAVSKIDELLDIAQQMRDQQQQQQQQQQGQGQNQRQSGEQQQQQQGRQQQGQRQEQEGQSSRDRSREQSSSGRENTPEGPSEAGASQQPGEEQGEQANQGNDPSAGRENPAGGENNPDSQQPDRRGESGSDSAGFGSWGELPPRAQEVFTNRASDDMPPQYRDWIDSYYRRVAKTP